MANISGTSGNDSLTGTDFSDTILGLAGNDNLSGGAGNDSLQGGEGDDYLSGGAGNDTLDGGADGQYGDTVDYSTSGAGVQVNLTTGIASDGMGGTDTLIDIEHINGSAFADTLTGNAKTNWFRPGAGNDTVDGGDGRDVVMYEDALAAVNVNLKSGTASGNSIGTDSLTSIEAAHGSNFNDSLTLTDGGGYLFGRGGNDTLVGGAGNDNFIPGSGNDSIVGGAGTDQVSYISDFDPAGTPTMGVTVNLTTGLATDNWGGSDSLASIENASGSGLADTLIGDANSNYLEGMGGNDTLIGRAGNDTLVGGDGQDSAAYLVANSSTATLTYSWDATANAVLVKQGTTALAKISAAATAGNWTVQDLGNATATGFGTDTLSSIESLVFDFGTGSTTTSALTITAAQLASAFPAPVSTATKIDWTSDQNGLGSVQGDDLYFQVHFTNPVLITGTPQLSLIITNDSGVQRTVQATFAPYTGVTPGSTQTSMQFKYTLQQGDTGRYHLGDLRLNGGSITEASWVGGLAADITLNSSNKTLTAGTYLFGAPVLGSTGTAGNDALLPYEANPALAPTNGTFTGVDGGAGNFDALVIPVLLPASVTTAAAAAAYTLKYTGSSVTATAPDGTTVVATVTVPTSFPTGVEVLAFHAVFNSGAGYQDANISGVTLSKNLFTVDDPVSPNEHYVQGSINADTINLSADTGANARYLVRGGPGNDTIIGSSGKDAIVGEGGNDSITAGAGDDAIFVGSGTDTVDGGEGSDKVVATLGGQMLGISSRINGFVLQSLTGTWGSTGFTATGTSNVYRVLTDDTGALIIKNMGDGSTAMTATNVEALEVRLNQSDVRSTIPLIFGDSNANTLTGTGGSIVNGEPGNDTLTASNNGDALFGGSGNDTLVGGSDRDLMYGGGGDDSMTGNAGNDWFVGNEGNDALNGGDGEDSAGFLVANDTTSGAATSLTYAWDATAQAVLVKQGSTALAKITAGAGAGSWTVQDLG
ncbi:MAG: calcium-binding protein, partial [Betaproteobacteria bacterium]